MLEVCGKKYLVDCGMEQGINPVWLDGVCLSVTSDESKQINFDKLPKVILSASGMCEAGRVRHHLKHNLWGEENTILFVGWRNLLGSEYQEFDLVVAQINGRPYE